eukprot:1586469-Rhodomonas_salina.1
MNQSNFVLLSMSGRRNENKELHLNVFIGLTDHYPKDFVRDTGIQVQMQGRVNWELESTYHNSYRDDDEFDFEATEKQIKDDVLREYFGPDRNHRFYHVIVFKLNLEVFGTEEYEMLWHLVSAQHSVPMILPSYSVTPTQIISMIENNEKKIAWKMTQRPRLGKASAAAKLPLEISSRISKEAPAPPKRGMDTWQQEGAAWA